MSAAPRAHKKMPPPANPAHRAALDYVGNKLRNRLGADVVTYEDGFAVRVVRPDTLSFASVEEIVHPNNKLVHGLSMTPECGDLRVRVFVRPSAALAAVAAANAGLRRAKPMQGFAARPEPPAELRACVDDVGGAMVQSLPVRDVPRGETREFPFAPPSAVDGDRFELNAPLAPGAGITDDDLHAVALRAKAYGGTVCVGVDGGALVVQACVPAGADRRGRKRGPGAAAAPGGAKRTR